jgi:large subunit ribosomal protein L33
MAKTSMVKIKMVSAADTGYYYVTKKNSRTKTDKLVKKKYDPIAKRRKVNLTQGAQKSNAGMAHSLRIRPSPETGAPSR